MIDIFRQIAIVTLFTESVKLVKAGAIATTTINGHGIQDVLNLAKTLSDVEVSEAIDGPATGQKIFYIREPLVGYQQYPFSYKRWEVKVVNNP